MKNSINWPQRRAGKVVPARFSHHLISTHLDLDSAQSIASRRRAGCGHGIGGMIEQLWFYDFMDQPKQRWRDVDLIGNQTNLQPGRFQHAPQDVIMAIEFSRASIAEMREPARSRLHGPTQDFLQGIGVAKADFDPKRHCACNRFNCAIPLGSKREQ